MSDRRVIDTEVLMAHVARTPGLLRIVHRWCRLNGIDPSHVPVPSDLVIEDCAYGRVIRYEAYLTTEDGRRYLDPADPSRVATARRTALLQLAPPADWLSTKEDDL